MDYTDIENSAQNSKGLLKAEYRNMVLERNTGRDIAENEKERFAREVSRLGGELKPECFNACPVRFKIPLKIRIKNIIGRLKFVFGDDRD